MQRKLAMNRCLSTLLGAAAVIALAVPGLSQAPSRNLDFYDGGDPETSGLKLGGWGSGKATTDRTYKTTGEASIKVETNGFYSGGRIQFDEPRDITAVKADPFGCLEMTVKFQPGTKDDNDSPGSGGGAPPGFAGFPGGAGAGRAGGAAGRAGGTGGATRNRRGNQGGARQPGGGAPPGFGGFPGFPGAGGFPGTPGSAEDVAPDTTKLKVVLVCKEGNFAATNFPVSLNPARDEGWFLVAIPWVSFKGLEKVPTAHVKEIRIFGDAKDAFWIASIHNTTDDEPIVVEALEDQEVTVDDTVEFTAAATAGVSPLQYVWDFDLSDGLQEDAIGRVVTHTFKKASKEVAGKPGELAPYVVTLTVRDLGGAKRPQRRTASVIVNP
jgi:hypothetical protein